MYIVYKNITLLLTCFVFINSGLAGTLDELEQDATTPQTESKRSSSKSSSGHHSDPNSLESALAEAFFRVTLKLVEFTGKAVVGMGAMSQERYQRTEPLDDKAKPFQLFRKPGDPLLPTFSFNAHWLNGNDNINARHNRVEIGYGPLGVSYSQNTLNENGDKLTLTNTLIHYRMSIGNNFSWDLAYGLGKMNGNQSHDGDVFAMPIRARIKPKFYLEYIPTWSSYNGGSLAEHQFSGNWRFNHTGLSLGYKKWSAGDTSVRGFFAGFSINY